MIGEFEHETLRSLLGAYALDALDDDERLVAADHLRGCPQCRAEVADHREVAAFLARTGAPAPDGLWNRIASELDGRTAPPMRLVLSAGQEQAPVATNVGPAERPAVRRLRRTAVALTAIAASLLVVTLLAATITQRADIADLRDERALDAAATRAFASPDARTTDLRTIPDGTTEPGQVLARVALLPDGAGFMLAEGLADLDEGLYQLWGVTGDQVVSLGPLGSDPDVVPFHADESVTGLMVTYEDELVEQPTSTALVAGTLA